ncbi:MAG: electron transport complex subunit E [Rikenellaceae bacterium]|nr:electron transport complex subunit E [Rikenellaceae bacterium]
MNKLAILTRGIIRDNPVFILLLGMCPTLGTTSSAVNGFGMGAATLFVLTLSNIVISSVKRFIPAKVRIPAYIVVIASLVTILQLCMEAYTNELYQTLGVFIPLIVVNCIILGRAEAFASKNSVTDSALDGLGIGLGFTLALTALGAVREILGAGSVFGFDFVTKTGLLLQKWGASEGVVQSFLQWDGVLLFVLAPGAFIALGYLLVIFNKLTKAK